MKRSRQDDNRNNSKHRRIKHLRGSSSRDGRITDLLRICLQKVCELQADLQRDDVPENDPEAAGYAACAIETIRFLSAEGVPPDHPIVKRLTERLLESRDLND